MQDLKPFLLVNLPGLLSKQTNRQARPEASVLRNHRRISIEILLILQLEFAIGKMVENNNLS